MQRLVCGFGCAIENNLIARAGMPVTDKMRGGGTAMLGPPAALHSEAVFFFLSRLTRTPQQGRTRQGPRVSPPARIGQEEHEAVVPIDGQNGPQPRRCFENVGPPAVTSVLLLGTISKRRLKPPCSLRPSLRR